MLRAEGWPGIESFVRMQHTRNKSLAFSYTVRVNHLSTLVGKDLFAGLIQLFLDYTYRVCLPMLSCPTSYVWFRQALIFSLSLLPLSISACFSSGSNPWSCVRFARMCLYCAAERRIGKHNSFAGLVSFQWSRIGGRGNVFRENFYDIYISIGVGR